MTDRSRLKKKQKKGNERRGNANATQQARQNLKEAAKTIEDKITQSSARTQSSSSYGGNEPIRRGGSNNTQRTTSTASTSISRRNERQTQYYGGISREGKVKSTAERMKERTEARELQRDNIRRGKNFTGGRRYEGSNTVRDRIKNRSTAFEDTQKEIIKGAAQQQIGGYEKFIGNMTRGEATGKSGAMNRKLGGSSNTRRNNRLKPGQDVGKRPDNTETIKNIQKQRQKSADEISKRGSQNIAKGTETIQNVKNAISSKAVTIDENGDWKFDKEKERGAKFKNWLVDLEVAGLQMGGDALVGVATGGVGGMASMFARAGGMAMDEAERNGASKEQATKYGLAIGGVEALTEKMFMVASPLRKVYGKGAADTLMAKVMGKMGAKTTAGEIGQKTFMAALTEGLEEMVAEGVEPEVANRIYADAVASTQRDNVYNDALEKGYSVEEAQKFASEAYNAIHQSTSLADIFRAGSIGAAMGGILGGAGNVIEAGRGAELKKIYGKDGAREMAQKAKDVDDNETVASATAILERINNGEEITAGQMNAVYNAVAQQEAKDDETMRRYDAGIYAEMRRNGYESPLVEDEENGVVGLNRIASDKYQAVMGEAREAANEVVDSEEESGAIADAIAAVMTGIASPQQVSMFTTSNPQARAVFESVTGETLPKSNAQMREKLFAMSARNFVDTAREETDYLRDQINGVLNIDMTQDYGSSGQSAFADVMEDDAIDPRDNNKTVAASAFEDYYRAGALGIPMEQILQNGNPQHSTLSMEQKQAAYEAGIRDAQAQTSIPAGSAIAMGKRLSMAKTGRPTGMLYVELSDETKPMFTGSQQRMYRELAKRLHINIHIVDDIVDDEGNVVGANGYYNKGEVYLSMNNDRGLELVFGHEVTHLIKASSPEAYAKLEELVRDRWEEQGGIDDAIKAKQEQYKSAVGQSLSESDALEEIIADATYEMFGDPEFVAKVCAEEKTLGKTILYAIRTILANIRAALASSGGFTPSQNAQLLSQLDILSEFEDLWLQGLRDAAREGERIQSETVAESVTEEDANNSDSVNDFIRLSIREEDMSHDLVERLNGEKKVKVYRAMQYIDGRLYPPMAAVVEGNLNGGTELNKWEQAEERPDLGVWKLKAGGKEVDKDTPGAKLYFNLKKGNGTSLDARYNPYIHTSLSPLNDQFSSAYARPNMVVVEGEVPESELTSGYKAELAKDSVGETEWKSGKVAGELKKVGKPRRVILSRYFRPTRVLENDEVAQEIAKLLEGTDIKIPANVVTPGLLSALEERGVEIDRENVPKKYKESETRFSVRDQDYMDAVERGDMEAAQQMVDEAAREAGYTTRAYHGTPTGGFTVFKTDYVGNGRVFGNGTYLTSSEAVAEEYSYPNGRAYSRAEKEGVGINKKVYDTYIKVGEDALVFDLDNYVDNGRKQSRKAAAQLIQVDVELDPDKDVVVHNIRDGSDEMSTVYVIKDATRIKSADPVVYDDNGNVIPLSERFNQENADIRYSVRDQNKRDAGEKLTESQFYRLYSAHKLDLRKRGNIEEQVESIKRDGFRGDAGFGNNVVPAGINNVTRYTEAERREFLSEYLSEEQVEESIKEQRENPGHGFWSEDVYFPEVNITAYKYGGRKGDTVLLVPEGSLNANKYTQSVKNGFKPFDYEVVTVERDFQPYYELYSKAYDETKTKFSIKKTDSEGRKLTEAQMEYFSDIAPELKDEEGRLKRYYHGIARADRVGTVFDPERATSGPMAYFTDDPVIAENYSNGKSDTSLAYEDAHNYYNQFVIEEDGEEINLLDYWYLLSLEQQKEFRERAGHITQDDDYENFIIDESVTNGNGGYATDPYTVRQAHGNVFRMLEDAWLQSGDLFNEEARFVDLMELLGMDNVKYKDPDYREEKVYECYLNVTNPVVTSEIDEEFCNDVEDWLDATDLSYYENESASADFWDKNDVDPYDWLDRLREDVANGTTYAWTSVPDAITAFMTEQGYDGVVDTGGKYTDVRHQVVIPFRSNQVKDINNENPSSNDDIRFSIKDESRVMQTPSGVEVVQNPTDSEYRSMRNEILDNYPWLRGTGEVLLRKTYDEDGNEYYWDAFSAMHSQVEPYINKHYGTRTSQQWQWWTRDDKDDYPIDYGEHGTRFSVREDLGNDLQKVLDGTFPDNGEVLIGNTSDFLVNVMGANPLSVTMPASKAYRAMVSEEQAKKDGKYKPSQNDEDHYHNLGKDGLINALEASENPIVAFASKPDYSSGDRRIGRIVLVTEEKDENDDYIVIIQRVDSKARVNGRRGKSNKVITAFGKDYIEGQIKDAIADDRILFADKKRSHLVVGGTERRSFSGRNYDFTDNIDDFWANVNYEKMKGRYSIREEAPEPAPMPTEEDAIDYANGDPALAEFAYDASPYAQAGKAVREKSYDELKAKVERLQADKRLTHGRVLDTTSIRKDVENMLRTMASIAEQAGNPVLGLEGKMNKANARLVNDIIKNAKHIYKMMKSGREEEAVIAAMNVADDIVERIQVIDDAEYDTYKEMKKYLRETPITISEEDASNIPDFGTFKKDLFGKVRIVKEGGLPVDSVYEELMEMFPGVFDEEVTHPADQLMAIVDAREAFEPYDVMLTAEEREQLLKDTTMELLDIIADGEPWRSWADKKSEQYQNKVKMLQERHREALRSRTEKERARAERLVQAEKTKAKEKKEKAKDKKERLKAFGSIEKNHKWLSDRLLKPTDDKHIPEDYKIAVADLLMTLDLQTERSKALEEKTGRVAQKTFKFRELLDAYEEIANPEGTGILEYDDTIVSMLKDSLAIKLDGKSVDALDTATMREVDTLLKAIVGNIKNVNKAFAAERDQTIDEMAAQVTADCNHIIDKRGTFSERKKNLKRYFLETSKVINIGMKKPREFFTHLGKGMTDAYMEIRHGEDKHFRNMQVLRERFEEIFKQYNNKKKPGSAIEKWRDTSTLQTFELENGDSVKLNIAQVMSLYCLSKREQALGHIYGSGIVPSKVEGISGKIIHKKNEVEGSKVMVTYGDVMKIIDSLTEEQRTMADQLQELLNNEVAAWGNETSMLLYNYEKFTEKNYFPIKSDDAYLDSSFEGRTAEERIRNFGFTKGTITNANNPIVIADIFEVVTDHCNKMSLYNSFAAPLADFTRLYNSKFRNEDGTLNSSVKDMITKAYGKDTHEYIQNFMADVNNNTQVRPDETRAVVNKFLANYKRATIGMNMRVAVQQPTAIVRAFDVIDPKYFVADKQVVAPWKIKRDVKEMCDHCPIAMWKSWGHNDVDMARDLDDIMMNKAWSRFDIVTMGTYGALDIWTWSKIWNAVKREVKAKNPGVEVGSDEYWNLCNERASEVFDRTQVVDSVLHRSQTMRSKDTMTKMISSFMAEPTTTFNMLQSDIAEARDLIMDGEKGKAAKKLTRCMTVFGLNAAAVSAAAAVIDLLRGKEPDDDDKDKEGFELWYANFLNNFIDNANPIKMIPYPSTAFELFEGTFGTSNMAFEGWESLAKGLKELQKYLSGDSKKSEFEVMWMVGDGIGNVLGIPIKSIDKDYHALMNRLGISFATDGSEEKVRVTGDDGSIFEFYPGENMSLTEKFFKMIGIEDNSKTDNFLNKFGINLSEEEKQEQEYQNRKDEILKKCEGLEGEEREKKLWSIITGKKDEENLGITSYIESADFDKVEEMKKLYVACGGDKATFDEKVIKKAKTAYKKTIGIDDAMERQFDTYDFLIRNGVSEAEISEIVKSSDTAREFKKAYALGDDTSAALALSYLTDAGISYEDYEYLCSVASRSVKASDYATGEFDWPTSGTVTSGFGRRSSPTAGASSYHQAIDIGAPTGTPVKAADGGKVIYCGWYGGYGNRVVVDHGNGYKTCYSHLSGYEVQKGQVLKKGQQLGKVGSTGVSTGPHLDFQVEQNGSYVDPQKYLQR